MAMVFCRGCGKEIHETAPICPFCGAPQGMKVQRNLFILILAAIGWSVLFWLGFLFLSGMVIGALNPQNPQEAGAAFGEEFGFISLIGSVILSIVLTYLGKMPGTYKQK